METINTPITDSQLVTYFGPRFKHNIKTWSELQKYKSIDKLLPSDKSFKIILIELEQNSGHWVLIQRYGKTIEYFDSYGANPFYHVDGLPDKVNLSLDQSREYFKQILDDAKRKHYNVIYNRKRFQKIDDSIATCGRHAILRAILMKKFDMDLLGYIKWIKYMREKNNNITADELVSELIK